MFRTVPLSINRNFSLYTQQWYMSYRFADSLRAGANAPAHKLSTKLYDIYHCRVYSENSWWWTEELSETCRVSRSKCSCSQAVNKPVWHILLPCVQWKTPDDGRRNCPKHVEFQSKNKFEKLVHLVGFIIRYLSRCTVVTWTSNGCGNQLSNTATCWACYRVYITLLCAFHW